MNASKVLDLFAITPPGLEGITSQELDELGFGPTSPCEGGVEFKGTLDTIYGANLHSRTASRILIRLASFKAGHFSELYKHTKKIDWGPYLSSGSTAPTIKATCHKSRLYHTGKITQVILDSLSSHISFPDEATHSTIGQGENPTIYVRFVRDNCVMSLDTSGELLHKRGYRKLTSQAPIRENIAAALLLWANWKGDVPLLDPMCGSGTFPIEAAMLACKCPPGIDRAFGFSRWPSHKPSQWEKLVRVAKQTILPKSPVPIVGWDANAKCVAMASENASFLLQQESALSFAKTDLRQIDHQTMHGLGPRGMLITNPPYGHRLKTSGNSSQTYRDLGHFLNIHAAAWDAVILAKDLAHKNHLPKNLFLQTKRLINGGIPVHALHVSHLNQTKKKEL